MFSTAEGIYLEVGDAWHRPLSHWICRIITSLKLRCEKRFTSHFSMVKDKGIDKVWEEGS